MLLEPQVEVDGGAAPVLREQVDIGHGVRSGTA